MNRETNKTAIEVDVVPSIHTQSVSPQRVLLDEKGNDSARRPSKGVALWKMRNEVLLLIYWLFVCIVKYICNCVFNLLSKDNRRFQVEVQKQQNHCWCQCCD